MVKMGMGIGISCLQMGKCFEQTGNDVTVPSVSSEGAQGAALDPERPRSRLRWRSALVGKGAKSQGLRGAYGEPLQQPGALTALCK